MSFKESPRFPNYLAYGLSIGPMFATDLVRVNSGFESGNQRWEQALRMFDGSTTHRTQSERDEIEAFFQATARGRMHSFRLKDVTDFTVSAGPLTLISAGLYQLGKTYTSGAQSYVREIKKPVSGTVSVAGGGTYAIDYTTGILTHSAGPDPTSWTGEFDVPVRFDNDSLLWQIASKLSSSYLFVAPEMRLIEVRV